MKWELKETTLTITAEGGDKWKGSTTAQRVETVQGIECLRCGDVKVGRKRVSLCLRIDDKRGLAEIITEWEASRAAKREEYAAKERERQAACDRINEQAAKEFEDALQPILERIGDGVRIECDHNSAAADGWGHTDYRLDGVELTHALREGIEIQTEWVSSQIKHDGWNVPAKQQLIGWVSAADAATIRSRIAARQEKQDAARKAKAEQDEEIEAQRQELIDAGTRLATPKQLAVIDGAREDWFDLFDGATGYGMYGPSDDELQLMTIEKASRLVGQVIDARKALRAEGGH